MDTGRDLHRWVSDLFPICRSLTGPGVRETLTYIRGLVPDLTVHEVASGTKVLDWTVPDEWTITDAFIADESGNRLIDFADNNLHVMGYSTPVDVVMTREELEPHLYSLPDQPTAIPYVTSYYSRRWAFCLTQEQREGLGDGPFRAVIESTLEPGVLNYAELIIPGETDEEVLLSTYVCHPSMANNELSGPAVATALARWLQALPGRRYTYRILFLAETIGALAYLATHLDELRSRVRAGWVLSCMGDERDYSYLASRLGGTLADRVSMRVLEERGHGYTSYSYLSRGSDERQWCAPGVDLPVASLMRSKYNTFPEYHTSLDDLTLVTPDGLQGSLDMMKEAILLTEANRTWMSTVIGEPQLGSRGLYPTVSTKESVGMVMDFKNVLAYCDGAHDVIEIAEICNLPTSEVLRSIETLAQHELIALVG